METKPPAKVARDGDLAAPADYRMPLVEKDYVHRFDEYFQKRAAAPGAPQKPAGGYGY